MKFLGGKKYFYITDCLSCLFAISTLLLLISFPYVYTGITVVVESEMNLQYNLDILNENEEVQYKTKCRW